MGLQHHDRLADVGGNFNLSEVSYWTELQKLFVAQSSRGTVKGHLQKEDELGHLQKEDELTACGGAGTMKLVTTVSQVMWEVDNS
jgi:hypothetical protein